MVGAAGVRGRRPARVVRMPSGGMRRRDVARLPRRVRACVRVGLRRQCGWLAVRGGRRLTTVRLCGRRHRSSVRVWTARRRRRRMSHHGDTRAVVRRRGNRRRLGDVVARAVVACARSPVAGGRSVGSWRGSSGRGGLRQPSAGMTVSGCRDRGDGDPAGGGGGNCGSDDRGCLRVTADQCRQRREIHLDTSRRWAFPRGRAHTMYRRKHPARYILSTHGNDRAHRSKRSLTQMWPVQAISRRAPSSAASRSTRSRLRSAHRPEVRSSRRLCTALCSASGPTLAQTDTPRRTFSSR
jgi:hypothetical protein